MISFSRTYAASDKYQELFDAQFEQLPSYEKPNEKLAAILIELMLFSSSRSKIGVQVQKNIIVKWGKYWEIVEKIAKTQLIDKLWDKHMKYEKAFSTDFRIEFWVFANQHVKARSLDQCYNQMKQASAKEYDNNLLKLLHLQTKAYGIDAMEFLRSDTYLDFHTKKSKELAKKLKPSAINKKLLAISEDLSEMDKNVDMIAIKNLFRIVDRHMTTED